MTQWTVSTARSNFAALLKAARAGTPQSIRQSGERDVTVSAAAPEAPLVPLSYLLAALAERDAMSIALTQHQEKQLHPAATGSRSFADMHLPPNVSGDVVRWARSERGAFAAAEYAVNATQTMREVQEQLDLPLSTVVQVVDGLELTSGEPPLFDAECRGLITQIAHHAWGAEAEEALGAEWAPPLYGPGAR